jgi:RES domain-containing protein
MIISASKDPHNAIKAKTVKNPENSAGTINGARYNTKEIPAIHLAIGILTGLTKKAGNKVNKRSFAYLTIAGNKTYTPHNAFA